MGKKEMNQKIIKLINEEIEERGLSDKLAVYPIENTCTRRPRYWNDGQINHFKIFMWDLNKLEGDELSDEIRVRINQAIEYFGLEN